MQKQNMMKAVSLVLIAVSALSLFLNCNKMTDKSSVSYTVKFNVKGGSSVPQLQVRAEEKIKEPAPPTKSGFTFDGWYKDEAGSAPWNFDKETVTKDLVLYAKWKQVPMTPEEPNPKQPNPGESEKYRVTFDKNSEHGTLTATVDEKELSSEDPVEKGKTVGFTAQPSSEDYTVDKWTISGGSFREGGNQGDKTAVLTVTADTKVAVTFRSKKVALDKPTITAAVENETVTLKWKDVPHAVGYSLSWNDGPEKQVSSPHKEEKLSSGTTYRYKLKAKAPVDTQYIDSDYVEGTVKTPAAVNSVTLNATNIQLDSGASTKLTATIGPTEATNKKVTWKSEDPSIVSINPEGGPQESLECTVFGHNFGETSITVTTEDGSKTATCKIKVSPAKIPYGKLDEYLKNASAAGVTHIDITDGLSADDLKGDDVNFQSSPLGDILRNRKKKVVITLPDNLQGVTSMEACFLGCTNLVGLKGIPSSVTDMKACFNGCSSLVDVSDLPVNLMNIDRCFFNCKSLPGVTLQCLAHSLNDKCLNTFQKCMMLKNGGIKVPHGQLSAYQAKADKMKVTPEKFAEKEKD